MTLQASVSMSWVNTVLAAAERAGVPRERLLAQAGIAPAELARERWPIDHITRLWRAAVHCTQDAGFGLKAGALVGPGSFNVVSYLLQSAPSLRGAISVVQQYQRLISDGGRFQMIAGARAGWVVYHPRQGALAFSPHQIEAVLAAVVAFSRWVTGQAVRPLQVQFSQPRVGPLAGYREAFACPVAFEQAFSGVLLDNALLDAPLPQADAQLARLHHQYAAQRLAVLHEGGALAQELRAWIAAALLGRVPTRAEAAQALGLSERTLARRMRAQRLSFSALLDAVRREAALQAVAERGRPLAEIGQALGYAEPSVFWRAFRRWTGQTPAQWRGAAVH
ncbi:AraC family transcriptional regulator [Alicycliphilus denitrificans]|uniref:Transcriptional regulator, Fis family n=1 Tax=Alicycliphilus denitrificans (strain DSM 14773 / CIP 107495 / K601) TaxID=596154 RepID=F4GA76_ALIDK|nr:AraC family transcriptional regulator [Alicycliphilus denitrificans]AEB83431.1 transcriptional regulator, Fis family [Alicycliphilus denitrificans K601]